MLAIGIVLATLAGLGIIIIGIMYLVAPRTTAASFGLQELPQSDATAWLRVKGVRDVATGVVAGVLLLSAPLDVLAWCVLAFVLIPAGDAAVVLRSSGSHAAAWGIHGTTVLVMLISVVLIFAGAA